MKSKAIILSIVVFLFNSFLLQTQTTEYPKNNGIVSLIIFGILLLFFVLFYLIPIIDILKSKFESGVDKLIWLAVVIFIPILGLLLYIFIGLKQKVKNKE
ncbi:MAG: hypothetical protein GX361_02940 [Bacteroidales bacterium]|nr:hypothetical protein [Bacteroidales bacterium]